MSAQLKLEQNKTNFCYESLTEQFKIIREVITRNLKPKQYCLGSTV